MADGRGPTGKTLPSGFIDDAPALPTITRKKRGRAGNRLNSKNVITSKISGQEENQKSIDAEPQKASNLLKEAIEEPEVEQNHDNMEEVTNNNNNDDENNSQKIEEDNRSILNGSAEVNSINANNFSGDKPKETDFCKNDNFENLQMIDFSQVSQWFVKFCEFCGYDWFGFGFNSMNRNFSKIMLLYSLS